MTEREKLIELIYSAVKNVCCTPVGMPMEEAEKLICEQIADYLLANGVIVPPVKVGDKVYVLEYCTCYNDYSIYEHCHHRRTKATKWIDMVRVPTKHHTKCLKLFERPFKWDYYSKLGKTVFLSREDAEKALKGVE